ncbi:ExeM/NucH family extracellular endonuclease [Rhodocytophaga aerolata]|uniref:ExeM/NucH family extracellular endonuclease n=1 Tax=Rhodocytophaga aerolata TaxID=455078 RepID=A0ABT8RED2_9BACT|nr:ExeM/NucH family extracellular endonuclease [Rhodocytophaga aerolata]MDO1449097.1 ExeM/NucH family extracellular endonuclease [Rhodocytophaga aerolata]
MNQHLRKVTLLAVMSFFLLAASAGNLWSQSSGLFFSEYIEGSSNNKALEIYNGTGEAVNLSTDGYVVQMYFNGSATPGLSIALSGTVVAKDVFVLAQATANSTILAQADQTNGAGWFNGDDAIVLRKGGPTGTIIDVIGQVGTDPGTEWGSGLTSTADNTLRRKSFVLTGENNPADAFDPSVEWDGLATDTFDGLGTHTVDCFTNELFFSEYIEGSSNNKALEIYNGTSNTIDLAASGYNVQMYFNGATSAGLTINLTGSVAKGDVFILAQAGANAAILAQADQTNGAGWFNGDDVVVLRKGTTIIDRIGQIGFDPGTEWGSGLTSTADNTLRRKKTVVSGDADGSNVFDPTVEWEGLAIDIVDGLGTHEADCQNSGIRLPVLSISDVTKQEGNSGSTDFTFTISLSPAATSPVSFSIATADGTALANSDYQAQSLTGVSIAAGATTYSFTVEVNGDTEAEQDETFAVAITDVQGATPGNLSGTATLLNDDATPITPIYTIQGSGLASPLVGQTVTTTGIVTGDYQGSTGLNGFYIQDISGDGDLATSDGIFVFSNTTATEGQVVQVTGPVREVFNQTQIGNTGDNVSIAIQDGTASITPVTIALPVFATTDLERYEGMLVQFQQTLTVTENFNLARFGEVLLSAKPEYPFETDGRLFNPTNFIDPTDIPAAGTENDQDNKAAIVSQQTANALHTILLDDGSNTQNPTTVPYLSDENTLRVGSQVSELTGILGFGFNVYRIQPTQAPQFNYAARPIQAPSTGNANVTVASFNVLNYFNGDGQGGGFPTSRGATTPEEFNRQRAKIIAALQGLNADIVGLIELENDGDGPTSAIADLVNGLNEQLSAGTYDYIRDPVNGGTGTDQIKVAFIYKPGIVTPLGAALADPTPVHNRPPLAQTFKLNTNGEVLTAIINHFKSKSGTGTGLNADQGDGQGNFNQDRIEQAQALVNFINTTVIPTAKDPDVLLMGDLNAYFEEDPIDVLRAAGYLSLFGPESYSYLFDGQSGSLDHALVSPSLYEQFTGGGKWHINADEPRALDYNTEFNPDYLYQPNPFRSSDHDPVLTGFSLQNPVVGFTEPASATIDERDGKYPITLTLSKPKLQEETITVSISTKARYGLHGKGDYIISPDGSAGKITLVVPAGATTVSFEVIPDKNAVKKKSPQTLTFTISETSKGLAIDASHATFALTITDNLLSDLKEKLLSLWPNPTNGLIHIVTEFQQQTMEATLRSPEGNVIYSGQGNALELSRQMSQVLQSRRGGLYHIQLIVEGEVFTTRILKF